MVHELDVLLPALIDAGSDDLTVHVEACRRVHANEREVKMEAQRDNAVCRHGNHHRKHIRQAGRYVESRRDFRGAHDPCDPLSEPVH